MANRTVDDMIRDLAKRVLPSGSEAEIEAKVEELRAQFDAALRSEKS